MNTKRASLFFLLLTTSCQVYQTNFDCPPCDGVPCTSVTEIQKMIIETPEGGPDIFLGKYANSSCEAETTCDTEKGSNRPKGKRRIWVEKEDTERSHTTGHFIYFEPLEGECQ